MEEMMPPYDGDIPMPIAKCGAKKRNGQPCTQYPVTGKKRCRMHGGTSLRGIAHPAYRHGRFSKVLPEGLRQRYESSEFGQTLLSHEDDIRLLDVQLGEWAAALRDDNDNTEAWGTILVAAEARRKLAESEIKRLVSTGQMMSRDDLLLIIHRIVDIIKSALDLYLDKETARKVAVEIQEGIRTLQTLIAQGPQDDA
jgi:hypothetical protein